MENSYRFYNNKACQYLPCHKVENVDEFNCMFCYCPLYFLEECGGNYKDNHGIKDCSNCLIPHRPNGYDHINKIIMEINEKRVMEKFLADRDKK
ncbi:MAG: cysteine-rich small domain-containing protein [Tissierellaceae bacterium]